jgi:16S rRNA (guanine527-N7)-methyltransferase
MLWNRTHHLTSLRTRAAIYRGLFLDSLLFRSLLPSGPTRIADIGAGAGIPGVPIRIVDPGVALTLIESRRKPVSFLGALMRGLELHDVEIRHGRAEALLAESTDLSGSFDVVLTRSVGLKRDILDSAMAYLKPGGRLIASGPPTGKPLRKVDWSGSYEWKTIVYGKIHITRRFFLALRQS